MSGGPAAGSSSVISPSRPALLSTSKCSVFVAQPYLLLTYDKTGWLDEATNATEMVELRRFPRRRMMAIPTPALVDRGLNVGTEVFRKNAGVIFLLSELSPMIF